MLPALLPVRPVIALTTALQSYSSCFYPADVALHVTQVSFAKITTFASLTPLLFSFILLPMQLLSQMTVTVLGLEKTDCSLLF